MGHDRLFKYLILISQSNLFYAAFNIRSEFLAERGPHTLMLPLLAVLSGPRSEISRVGEPGEQSQLTEEEEASFSIVSDAH